MGKIINLSQEQHRPTACKLKEYEPGTAGEMVKIFFKLNAHGQQKAFEYISDIAALAKYTSNIICINFKTGEIVQSRREG